VFGGGLEPTCTRCSDPELRKRWGCDEPAADPVTSIAPCFLCHGRQPDCPECHGENEIPIRTCPRRTIRSEHRTACLLVLELENGLLPAPGGLLDQAQTFVDAMPLLINELEHWRGVLHERARRRAASCSH
jgi:hypothetical protein